MLSNNRLGFTVSTNNLITSINKTVTIDYNGYATELPVTQVLDNKALNKAIKASLLTRYIVDKLRQLPIQNNGIYNPL